MAYEVFECAQDDFGKFIYQLQSKTKTFGRELERMLIELYRHNASLVFKQTYLYFFPSYNVWKHVRYPSLISHQPGVITQFRYIYIYIYMFRSLWTSPEGSTPESSSCRAIYYPSRKLSIQVRRTRHAGHYWGSRDNLISDVLPWAPVDEQKQDDQPESTYNSSVPIRDVAPKTCQKQWTIGRGGEKGSVIPLLMAWHDDDDNIYIYIYT